jgi:hypothetical protein
MASGEASRAITLLSAVGRAETESAKMEVMAKKRMMLDLVNELGKRRFECVDVLLEGSESCCCTDD